MSKITGPLFKCFGSKWLSSKTLPKPEKPMICEPFAGGAGYSLRHHEKQVVLFETNEHVYDLWAWLIRQASSQDILDIPVGLAAGTDIRHLGLKYGQQLLLKNWQRTNNFGNCWTVSGWGHLPGQWTENTRARVAEEALAIRHWEIRMQCGSRAIESNANVTQEVTWFIDPPYRHNYQYRLTRALDYKTMGRNIRNLRGQVIVCEALHPKTGEFPQWLPFELWEKRVTSRRAVGNHTHSSELLWTNTQPLLGSNP